MSDKMFGLYSNNLSTVCARFNVTELSSDNSNHKKQSTYWSDRKPSNYFEIGEVHRKKQFGPTFILEAAKFKIQVGPFV